MKSDSDNANGEDVLGKRELWGRGAVVGVVRDENGYHLVAQRDFLAGERLFEIEGDIVSAPSRYSVQVGEGSHVDAGSERALEEILERHYWIFMNHSCAPTVYLAERSVFAIRDIEFGESITFDYNTTEWEMAESFRCECGSPLCLGEIQGYKYLTEPQRRALRFVAPHIEGMGDDERSH